MSGGNSSSNSTFYVSDLFDWFMGKSKSSGSKGASAKGKDSKGSKGAKSSKGKKSSGKKSSKSDRKSVV